MTFTRQHKGAYMDLLMCQFNNGPLTLDDVQTVLGQDFAPFWESKLKAKFAVDDQGRFYNKRLEDEKERRKSFTASRRNNLHHMDAHMETHMKKQPTGKEIIEKIVSKRVKRDRFVPPTIEEIEAYKKERGEIAKTISPKRFLDHYTTNGWKQGKGKPVVDWKAAFRTWEANEDRPAPPKRRPVGIRVIEYKALKWDDRRVIDQLTGEGYTEHEVNEAIGKRY